MNRKRIYNLIAVFAAVVTIAVFIFVCKPSTPYQAESTRRMAERLAELTKNIDFRANIYASSERAKYIAEREPPLDSTKRLILNYNLALELLRAGEMEEAIDKFTQVLQQATGTHKDLVPPHRVKIIRNLLALSYLRLGEQDNCINQHTSDSCLLPIKGKGIHTIKRGSLGAIKGYSALLNEDPDNIAFRWLLNIAYMTLGEYPDKVPEKWLIPPEVFNSDYDIKRFRDVAPHLGLDVMGLSGGSIMEDFDGDGYLDILASSWGMRDQIRYFRNNRDGTFTERTEQAGLTGIVGGLNTCQADYNNDGYPDVLVLRGAWLWSKRQGNQPNSLLRNNRDGTFDDVTEEAGLLTFHPTQTAAWGDYDNDGWVDLFIGNESYKSKRHPCQLYHNNGDGTFTELAGEVGVAALGTVKGVAWGDYNNDGLLDLYVSRLYEPNILYRNEGQSASGPWSFMDVSKEAGVIEPIYSFPTWFWDYNNDGWLDIFVSGYGFYDSESATVGPGMSGGDDAAGAVAAYYLGLPTNAECPRLYRNNGDGTFSDVTESCNLFRILHTMGCNFGDLDNDGFLDFYVGTGDADFQTIIPNLMFRNAEGRYFQDVTTSGGFGHLQKGHAVAFGDIDNDGDQDIYAVMGGAFVGDAFQNVLFENPGHGNHWITLKLEGVQSNRAGIGARIKISVNTENGRRDIYTTVTTGGSFGASSLQQEIGLGRAISIHQIEITWPTTGNIQIFKNVEMDQILRIREGDLAPIPLKLNRFSLSPDIVQSSSIH